MLSKVKFDRATQKTGYWLLFSGDRLLVHTDQQGVPRLDWQQLQFIHHYAESVCQLGAATDATHEPWFVIDLGAEHIEQAGWESVSLRSLLFGASETLFEQIAKGWQYLHFLRTHRFCGQCGSHTRQVDWEMATQCENCGHRAYPRVSPCIIVAIYSGDKMLLARGVRHKETNMYSTLAGFVESGETLEQAVHREVAEEVGVKVKNIEYFGSQPWPFPHSLMVGYIAEYDGGDIVIQENEIDDAGWFDIDDLPNTPPTFSIAGQLIAEVVKRRQLSQ